MQNCVSFKTTLSFRYNSLMLLRLHDWDAKFIVESQFVNASNFKHIIIIVIIIAEDDVYLGGAT